MSRPRRAALAGLPLAALACVLARAQNPPAPPQLVGASPPTAEVPAAPVPSTVTDDVRRIRNFPEQPPVIPHSIEGYQLTLNTNRCLTCHARQYVEGSGAPMIGVSHFTDRDGQVLADVAPRRYFCLQCHVSQADAPPLVANTFRAASGGQDR